MNYGKRVDNKNINYLCEVIVYPKNKSLFYKTYRIVKMVENWINKKIAKNTFLLYFRMMLTMLISLYTSRIILNVFGVEKFGIYLSVGGTILLLSFVNGALSAGSSRFLTFELGTGNKDKLQRIFTIVFFIHIILSILVIIIAKQIGFWFVDNKLVILDDLLEAATFAFYIFFHYYPSPFYCIYN